MKFYSPLRYPGGKNKLAKFVAKICVENNIHGHYVEPYAGGASVALYLLLNGYVGKITINDFDRSIYAFWHSVLFDTDRLCRKIQKTEVTVENWKKQREIQKKKKTEKDLLKLGFSTFFLNRTNYSGVIDGGVIGGIAQDGLYKIDCRFNKNELIQRIRLIAAHKENIRLENADALDLVKKIRKDKNTIFYFDPPYYLKGPSLYMNHYKHDDHKKVSEEIKKIKSARWLVSYDDVPEIQSLYAGMENINYSFNHSVCVPRIGKESVFCSENIFFPNIQNPVKVGAY